ncbi:hypothetical protein FRB90_009236 [Tulasnella sp. 427]|nr:hypothetical protein FRB90_009236 [Tulasnella sp. 427]
MSVETLQVLRFYGLGGVVTKDTDKGCFKHLKAYCGRPKNLKAMGPFPAIMEDFVRALEEIMPSLTLESLDVVNHTQAPVSDAMELTLRYLSDYVVWTTASYNHAELEDEARAKRPPREIERFKLPPVKQLWMAAEVKSKFLSQ